MIDFKLSFTLPLPWSGERFEVNKIGAINYLVGPNGSGKSRFAEAMKPYLNNARMLGTDRLSGMEKTNPMWTFMGDHFATGLPKGQFDKLKQAGVRGSGIDTLVLLEERPDLRIQVEATLSDLFNRKIILDWDSGNLVARASLGKKGKAYRLDREECHGIKELLILLTHLYNNEHSYLIIDEPELNLHPQYQAFFMQEVRKVAGEPAQRRKVIFLVTHSPFILDLRSVEDVKSVISFDLDYSVPKQIFELDSAGTARLASLVPRLNVHHKQLFFSDNPIFVEGILDAQLIGAIQEARGVSVAGAGSCIIDAGGCEEVNRYLELCRAFGKKAYFLYDLDSLFKGNLRGCVRNDLSVQHFLATAGVTNNFGKYCGELEQKLESVIDRLRSATSSSAALSQLTAYLGKLGPREEWNGKTRAKARVAVLTAISLDRTAIAAATSNYEVEEIEGRLRKIVEALRQVNIYLLPGGALERYLPAYSGDLYELCGEAKQKAVSEEIQELSKGMTDKDLSMRYGALYEALCQMPGKLGVNVEHVLRSYLGKYIHDLQATIVENPSWQVAEVQEHLNSVQPSTVKLFSIQSLDRQADSRFSAVIRIAEVGSAGPKLVRVSHETNAGMGKFEIERA
jgi:hypothetical protein